MIRVMLLLLLFVTLIPSVSQAGLIVQVRNTELIVGGVGWIDVEIYADDGDEFLVSGVSYDFLIEALPNAVGELRFVSNQDSSEQAEGNYLFAEQYGDGFNNFNAFLLDNDQLSGGDYTFDPGVPPSEPRNVPTRVTSGRKLIARLDVQHILPSGTDPSAAIDSMFAISLQLGSELEVQNELGNIISPIPLTGSGTLKIVATPEPSSVVLLAIAGGGWFTFRRRRKAVVGS